MIYVKKGSSFFPGITQAPVLLRGENCKSPGDMLRGNDASACVRGDDSVVTTSYGLGCPCDNRGRIEGGGIGVFAHEEKGTPLRAEYRFLLQNLERQKKDGEKRNRDK